MKRIIIISVVVIALLLIPSTAYAADKADFNPSAIIDDAVFYNSNSMSTSQIQDFLNSKNPSCDWDGTQPASDWGYPGITHAQLAQYKREGSHGFSQDTGFNAPPYKCLTMYTQTTPVMEAASGYCAGITAGTRTAAQIINDVSKACGINPQVLLVLLEKEQSLVTDDWPLDRQLEHATGFACPDTAACNPAFAGFFSQVYSAAKQFKIYQKNPNNYNYRAGRTNIVLWSPNTSCGTSNLYIQNQATASLYIYTPYRPNDAALNNLYGSGDGCSSYGNRNFWRMFTDWFGSTHEEFGYAFESMVGSGAYTFNSDVSITTKKTISIGNTVYTLFGDAKTHTLQLLYWNGVAWSKHTLDGPGSVSLGASQANVNPAAIEAFSYGGNIQYFYVDSVSNTLKHGFTMNGSLAVETLDGAANSYLGQARTLGSAISGFAYGGDGIQLYYFNTAANTLIHTWWNGRAWNTETLDGAANSYLGQARTLGSAISGTPYANGIQLFYYDTSNGELIHTFILNGRWASEIMDGDQNSVVKNTINAGKKIQVSNVDGRLIVLYYDDATGFSDHTSSWRIAYTSKNGGGWISNILDGGSNTSKSGSSVSPTLSDASIVGYNGTVQVFYNDASNNLRHVWLY